MKNATQIERLIRGVSASSKALSPENFSDRELKRIAHHRLEQLRSVAEDAVKHLSEPDNCKLIENSLSMHQGTNETSLWKLDRVVGEVGTESFGQDLSRYLVPVAVAYSPLNRIYQSFAQGARAPVVAGIGLISALILGALCIIQLDLLLVGGHNSPLLPLLALSESIVLSAIFMLVLRRIEFDFRLNELLKARYLQAFWISSDRSFAFREFHRSVRNCTMGNYYWSAPNGFSQDVEGGKWECGTSRVSFLQGRTFLGFWKIDSSLRLCVNALGMREESIVLVCAWLEATNFWLPSASVVEFAEQSWKAVTEAAQSVEEDNSYLEFAKCFSEIHTDKRAEG
jgi:hypothetical protein